MQNMLYTNPLETVQFISIFSYLNSLSDYLFLENYLTDDDQNKQIPVVNALYKYLDDNQANQGLKIRLVRKLLQGSDLYGENNHENLDVTFVNAMFEYIISSLVFHKYGNICGFLANIARKNNNLKLDSFFEEIKTSLRNATFENEYGTVSTLTPLAANRIFTDLILPLFPEPKTNLSLLSLDYIYAQAGAIFLRTGELKTTFYTDSENLNSTILDQNNFQDYVIIGHLIRNSLNNDNIRLVSFKAFALPAFLFYAYTKYFDNDDIKNMILEPHHLVKAFNDFFLYLNEITNKAVNKLKGDPNYQMHTKFSNFKSRSALAEHFMKINCQHLSEEEIKSKVIDYLYYPSYYHCIPHQLLPNLTESYEYQVSDICEAYKIDDSKLMQAFGKSFLKFLKYNHVVIQLLAPNDEIVFGVFNNKTRIPFDLFVLYYPENSTADYYALMRENNSITLIKDTDDPEIFHQKTGLTAQVLLSYEYHRINLKSANQSMDVFWKNFIEYKQLRLKSYLRYSGTGLTLGEWWKEFGLSLVPFYPRVTESIYGEAPENVHASEKIIFSHPWDKDISSKLTNSDTRSFFTKMGTTFDSIQVFLTVNEEYQVVAKNESIDDIVTKLVLHMEEPGFDLANLNEEDIRLMQTASDSLQQKMYHLSAYVLNILNKMRILKRNVFRNITYCKRAWKQYVFVKAEKTDKDTGYGYKFIYLPNNQIAQLRTDNKFKSKIFVSLQSSENVKTYIKINEISFEPEQPEYRLYEINNQLETRKTQLLFAGLSVHCYNFKQCDIITNIEHMIPLMGCPRHFRRTEKERYADECVNLALSKNTSLTRNQILETMAKYTFPDEERIDLKFVEDWLNTTDLKIPEWSKHYIIDSPDILSALRFEFHLDEPNLSITDGVSRIDAIYTFKERQQIEIGTSLENIISDFNEQNARYVAKFEDYYAVRNFATTGYTRITGSTFEAFHMKMALYKLAIRQSDDPEEEFDRTLFIIESKPIDIINETYVPDKIHILRQFSTTYVNEIDAINFTRVALPGYKNILYEMKFFKPCVNAKIKQFYYYDEKVAILLPGTEFSIVEITETQQFKLGFCLRVKLMYNYKSNNKYEWYKSIMKEISQITSKK